MYSALRNFEDMRKKLGQEHFPVVADEGVYQVIMDIVLSHPSEFPKLFPMMGIFHMAKVALHCAGKYFKGSGIDTALILAECFGKNTIESVLSEGSLRTFFAWDALESMKWEAFWMTRDSDEWLPYIDAIKKLLAVLSSKVGEDVVVAYREVDGMVVKLKDEMYRFHKECEEKSEICKYVFTRLIINKLD